MAKRNINICFFSGNLTRAPEVNISEAGNSYVRFTIAVNDENYDMKTQRYEPSTCYIDCIAFGEVADQAKTLSRGQKVSIECKLTQNTFHDDKCGVNRRYSLYRVISLDAAVPKNGRASGNVAQAIAERDAWAASIWG